MPTRRRDVTRPIDSSTRIVTRATVRETANSSWMPSRVSTRPSGSSPLPMTTDDDWVQTLDAGTLLLNRLTSLGHRLRDAIRPARPHLVHEHGQRGGQEHDL